MNEIHLIPISYPPAVPKDTFRVDKIATPELICESVAYSLARAGSYSNSK